MPRERRSLIAALGATFAGDASSRAAVLLISVLAARSLDPPQFAFYLVLVAVATLATGIWDAGVSTILVRAVSDDRTEISTAVTRALRLRLLTLPAWLVAAAIGFITVGYAGGPPIGPVLLFAAASLFAGTSLVPLAILRGRLRFGVAAASLAIGRWSTAAAVAAATTLPGPDSLLLRLAAAQVIGEVVTLSLAWFATARMRGDAGRGDTQHATEISLRAALPYAANGLLNIAYNRLDVVLVAVLTSTTQLAIYAPASRIQDALYLVSATTYVVAVPTLSRLVALGARPSVVRAHLQRIWVFGGALAGIGAITVFLFTDALISVVLGSEYLGSTLAVRIILWSMPLSVIGAPLLATLVAHGRGPDTTRAFAAAFGASLTLHLALDWWMGATGAAVASLARDAANVVVAGYFAARILRGSDAPKTPAATLTSSDVGSSGLG